MRAVSRLLGIALLAVALSAVPSYAQNGRITGTVRDASGTALSGVAMRATNQRTSATSRATTGADGRFTISGLPAGSYTVAASVPGLRTVSQNVQVAADQTVALDLVLQPLTLEAVTVTAMLREQELAKVPFSIAAPTAQALRLRGAENIEAIAANVAGFSVQNLGPGQSTVAMRGVSSGQIARDQPGVKEDVGAYLDDAPVSLSLFTPDLDLFDVSRVEVLRGPQGTLFGAGSLAGTVRYISTEPELGATHTFGEVGLHQVRSGAAGNNAKLGFNVPVGDKSAFRIVGYSSDLAGWMDAVQPNLRVNHDVNGGNRIGGRLAWRFEPSARFSLTPRFVYQKVRTNGWNRKDDFNILANPYTTTRPAVTLGPRELFTQQEEPFSDEFFLGAVNLRYALSNVVSLTSITSFTRRNIKVTRDGGALFASVVGASIGLPEDIYSLDAPFDDRTRSEVWTQELRLSGAGGRLTWVVGGFYTHNERHFGQDVIAIGFDTATAPIFGAPYGFTQGLRAPKDHLFWSDLNYDLSQGAVFGEATLSPSAKLDLTAGLRYYNFSEDRGLIFDGFLTNANTGTALVTDTGATNADGVVPRFIASYKASDGVTVNLQAARGFRLGGINDPLNYPSCVGTDSATFSGHGAWNDQKVWNFEASVKSRVLGGRGSVNVSAFYMDIQDLQLNVTAGSCSSRLVFNAPTARSQGVELEINATPTQNLDVAFSAALNDSKLTSTDTTGGVNVISGIQSGNRLPGVPKVQLTGALTYGWNVAVGSRASITGSFQHVGSRFTAIDDFGTGVCLSGVSPCPFGTVDMTKFEADEGGVTIGGPLTQSVFSFNPELPAYTLLNLRVGLRRSSWEAALFINNLTDEQALLALDRERGTRARVGYLTNQPRTVGVSLRFDY
jgi:iron complex outermembrane receptor protein